MKVIVAATTGDDASGASKALVTLCKILKKNNVKVGVILPFSGNLESELDKIQVPYWIFEERNSWYKPVKKKRYFKGLRYYRRCILNDLCIARIKKFLKKKKPDIVHVNAVTAYTVGKAAEDLNIPVVWHIREFMEEDLGITFINVKKSLKILNNADKMIAIFKTVKEKWMKRVTSPIQVIYDGVDINDYKLNRKTPHDTINITLYGRFVKGKGQYFLLRCLAKLKNQNCDKFHCYLAGQAEDSNYFNKCIKYINDNNLKKYVTYVGEINDIKSFLSDKDIVCVCSEKEGFGRVNVEAMLAQCVVVASDSGASKEIIQSGINGYLYKSNSEEDFLSKLKLAIQNKNIVDKISNQKYVIENFSAEKNTEEILKLYNKILNKI